MRKGGRFKRRLAHGFLPLIERSTKPTAVWAIAVVVLRKEATKEKLLGFDGSVGPPHVVPENRFGRMVRLSRLWLGSQTNSLHPKDIIVRK